MYPAADGVLTRQPLTHSPAGPGSRAHHGRRGGRVASVVRMREPVELSGEGSRAREVEMPHGDYRLTWTAQGSGGYFSVRLEGGQSSLLVSDDPAEADTGEVFIRFPGGRHIVSVEASELSWTITFTQL